MKHRIVNKLHIVETEGHINVYTEEEYTTLETHKSWWSRVKRTLNSMGTEPFKTN